MVLPGLLLLSVNGAWGQTTYYSRATGVWTDRATWSLTSGGVQVGAGVYPGASDNVIIERGYTVTVNITNAQCATLRVGPIATTNTAGTLTFSGTNPSLNVSGAVYVGGYGNANRDGTIIFTNSSTLDAGSITLGGTGATPGQGTLTMTAGGTIITAGITIGAGSGTWTRGSGTVVLDATNTLPATVFTNFNNLWISAGTATLGVSISSISGILTVNAGATLALTTFNIGATAGPTSLILECGAATGSSISGTGTLSLGGNIIVNDAAGPGIGGANISCQVALGATRTFIVADDGNNSADLTISGVINGAFGITKNGTGTLILSGNNTYTGATIIDEGILKLGATGGATNTPLGTTAGGTSVTAGAVFDLNGYTLGTSEPLTINGRGISDGGALINSNADVSYSGGITLGSASLIGTGGNISLGNNGIGGGKDLTKTGPGTLSLGSANTTVNGLIINEGTLASTSGVMYIAGDFNNSGTFIHNSGTININGTGAQTIAGVVYNNLVLSGSGIKTFDAAATIGGNLSINGAVADLGTFTAHTANSLYLGGIGVSNGSWGGTGSGASHINSTYFAAATGILNISTSSCTSGSWIGINSTDWNLASNWCDGSVPTESTDVVIPSGGNQPVISTAAVCKNLTINAGATLTIAGSNTLTINGDWTNSGTFIPNSGTVNFAGAVQKINNTTTFYSLSFSGSGSKTLQAAITVRNLQISGTATLDTRQYQITGNAGGTMNMDAGTELILGDPANAANIAFPTAFASGNINLNTTSTITYAANANQTVSGVPAYGNLRILPGNTANRTRTLAAATLITGNLTVEGSSSLVTGNNQLTLQGNFLNTGTFTPGTGTFNYNGGAQIVGAVTYYNLTLSGSGDKSITTGTLVSNTFDISEAAKASIGAGLNISAGSFSLNGAPQRGGTWGSSSSPAVNKNDTYFSSSTGYISTPSKTFYSRATGNWNTNNTWSYSSGGPAVEAGVYPVSGDVVNIQGNYIISVSSDATCASITFPAANPGLSTLTINGTNSLTVSGAITMGRPGNNNNNPYTINIGQGFLSCGSILLAGTTGTRATIINISTGILTVTGNFTSAGIASQLNFTGAGTVNAGGTFMSGTAGTFTASTGTVNYNGGAQTIGAYNYYNLTLSGSGTKTITTATTNVNNILSMEGTAAASAAPTYGTNATLQYKGSAVQSIGPEFIATFNANGGVVINNANGIILSGDRSVSSIITMLEGNITTGTNSLTLSNNSSASLVRSSGNIIGKFIRAVISTSEDYLFPVGTASNYRPAVMNFSSLSSATNITAEFISESPGVFTGYSDAGSNLINAFTEGFWRFTSSVLPPTRNYTLRLTGEGFSSYSINDETRITGRDNSNQTWRALGAHGSRSGNEISRTGVTDLNLSWFDFALAANCNAATMGYAYERDITIDHSKVAGGADLFNIPILVQLTGQTYLKTSPTGRISNPNGFDIIFTDPDYGRLDHQIEYYNGTSGDLIAWVRIPLLSSSINTVIKILYGNPEVTTDPSVTSVWDSHYRGVWHFDNNGLSDFTSYNKAATPYNTPTYPAGVLNNSLGLSSGSKEYAVAENAPHLNFTGNITISAWVYMNTRTRDQKIASNQNGSAGGFKFGIYTNNKVEFEIRNSSNTPSLNRDVTGGTDLQTGTWYYLAGISSDVLDSIKTFVNGVSERPFKKTGILGSSSNNLSIGREPFEDNYYFDGRFDELRISDKVRSDGWMLTEYNNQHSPASFYSVTGETASEYLISASMCNVPITLSFGYPAGGTYSGPYVTGASFSPPSAGTYQITYTYPGTCAGIVKSIEVSDIPAGPVAPNKQYCTGQIAYLEATSGSNIRWYNNIGVLVSTANPYSTGQTAVGTYNYTVTQTVNGCESAHVPVSLIITSGGASIVTQPSNITTCLGNNAIFTLSASGPNLVYRWRENGVDITDGGIYSGAATATLTLTGPGAGQNGKQYSCLITASCGAPASVSSNNATLTLTIPPVATFSYTGTPYCPTATNPSPAFSGGGVAGTFSAAPAGLVFVSTTTGQVNLAASAPGNYIVTNTVTASGCVVIATSPLGITSEIEWTGSAGTSWNDTGNWSCSLVPSALFSIHIPSVPNKPVLSAGTIGTVKNLTIDPGASLTISGNTLKISGTITNSGIFDASEGIIELNGIAPQSIPASAFTGNIIKDLTVNNPAGASVLGPLQISGVLFLQTGDLASNGNITLLSTAAGTACIDGNGTGDVTGTVKMQRYLSSGFGYKYFSSPFQSSKVKEFAEEVDFKYWFPLFYRYDENRKYDTAWLEPFEAYIDTTKFLIPFDGYVANLGDLSTPVTVEVSGVVNNGAYSRTLYDHGNPYSLGKILLGNPYPSPIDWVAADGWTKSNIDSAVYYFKASTTDQWGGIYSSWVNNTSSDGIASNIIPSMQGFLVRVSNPFPAMATITLDNRARVNNITQKFNRKSSVREEKSLLRLVAYFSDQYPACDAMVIYFDDKGTEDFDNQVDAVKYFNTDYSVPNLYSISSNLSKLSINGLPKPHGFVPEIPLGVKILQDGEVVFKLRDMSGPYPWRSVNLLDSLRGITTDLASGAVYKVNLTEGEYVNRFFLNIDGYGTGIEKKPGEQLFRIYSSGHNLYADIYSLSGKNGLISVISITGQVLFTKEIHEKGHYEFQPVSTEGIYLVTFVSGGIRKTEKIFIGGK